MSSENIFALLAIFATISTICVFLVPKNSQESLDQKALLLSEKIDKVTFWSFSTIERDVAFSLLTTIFQAKPTTCRFYFNVAGYAALLTLVALLPYAFIPFHDPLTVSKFGYQRFFLMGFFMPGMIFAVMSMVITVTLLTIGARIRFGLVYVVILVVDAVVASVMISALFVNLEMTRTYLLDLYYGNAVTNRWIALYQPLLALYYVASHPSSVFEAFKAEYYTSAKYTTYVLSVAAMVFAVLPLLIHTFAAAFIVISATFHDVMKRATSFVLKRAHEQKTFKMIAFLFGAPAACVEIWRRIFVIV